MGNLCISLVLSVREGVSMSVLLDCRQGGSQLRSQIQGVRELGRGVNQWCSDSFSPSVSQGASQSAVIETVSQSVRKLICQSVRVTAVRYYIRKWVCTLGSKRESDSSTIREESVEQSKRGSGSVSQWRKADKQSGRSPSGNQGGSESVSQWRKADKQWGRSPSGNQGGSEWVSQWGRRTNSEGGASYLVAFGEGRVAMSQSLCQSAGQSVSQSVGKAEK